jgi:PleD family two-component response regulator
MFGTHVLIIENEPDIAGFFKATLELDGFQCDVALTARDALMYLTTNVPDMILLDLHLGGEINGQDILYQVRINPLFQNTRVVVATAHPQVAKLVSHLADLVLLKPVDAYQLQTLAQRITSQEYEPKPLTFLDPVTGLYNQAFFNLRLEHAFERSRRRPDFFYGVILVRVEIPDLPEEPQEGIHEDFVATLYQVIARRLRTGLRSTDTLTRLSNWRFAVLLEELKQPDDIQVVEQRLRSALDERLEVGERVYSLQVFSAGQVNTPGSSRSGDLLAAVENSLRLSEQSQTGA